MDFIISISEFWSTPEELQTQLLPYVSLTNVTLHDPGKMSD